jgi:DNA polymerase-1
MFVDFQGTEERLLKGEVITTEKRLKRLAKRLMTVEEFAYDTETNTLRVQHQGEMDLVGISICFGEHDTYYIPTNHYFDDADDQLPVELVVKYLKPAFERTDVRIIGWNLKFDLHVLANVGIHIKTKDIFDGMIARWITNENVAKSLKECTSMKYGVAQTHFDECLATVTKEQKKELGLASNSKALFWMVKLAVGAPYALADAYWTWRHYVDWQMDEIKDEKMETIFYKVQMPFLVTLFNMERRGAKINIARLKEMQKKAEKDLADLEYKIVEIAGVELNIGSSQQLAELLFGYKKTNKKGEFSGNVKLLEKSFNYPT